MISIAFQKPKMSRKISNL